MFYIIGTGFSSYVVTNYFVLKGIKPTIIDIGSEFDTKDFELKITKPYFYNKELKSFSFFGGLSNVWKGVSSDHDKNDEELLLGKELNISEQEYNNFKSTIGINDAYIKIDKHDFKFTFKLNERFHEKYNNISFKGTHILANDKIDIEPLKLKEKYKALLNEKKINILKCELLKFDNNFLYIKNYVQSVETKLKYNYCFCGAGTIGTSKIISRSILRENIYFKTNKKLISFIFFKKIINFKKIKNFPFLQVFYSENKISPVNQAYMQVYYLPQLLNEFFNKKNNYFLNILFSNFFFKKIGISYISLPDIYSSNIKFNTANMEFSLSGNKRKFKFKDFTQLTRNINKFKKFYMFPVYFSLPDMTGNHFGSILYSKKSNTDTKNLEKVTFDDYGRIEKFKNFFFVDSSTFRFNGCKSPTSLILKNAYHIAKKFYEELYKKK